MAIAEVAGNTRYDPKYGYIALSLLYQQSITLSHWISAHVGAHQHRASSSTLSFYGTALVKEGAGPILQECSRIYKTWQII